MIFPKTVLNLEVATVRELCIACIANIIIAVGTFDHASSRLSEQRSIKLAQQFVKFNLLFVQMGSALTKV